MRYIKLTTEADAIALNERVTKDCLAEGIWQNGTNNYCDPEHTEFWLVPVLDGYEQFFTKEELSGLDSDQQLLQEQIAKGKIIIESYLLDNKKLDITSAESLDQLSKFATIKTLLEVGAITLAQSLLSQTPPDKIFTQERKDKYLSMLS